MKNIFKIALTVFVTIFCSCSFNSKKKTADTIVKKVIRNLNIVQSTNLVTAQVKFKDTTLIFPEFTVRLHNFDVHGGADGQGEYYYNGDSYEGHSNIDEKKDYWSLNIKKDTAHLKIYGWDHGNTLEIISKDKRDSFKISHNIRVCIIEFTEGKGVSLTIKMPYKFLKDSVNWFFKIPNHNVYDSQSDTAEVKKLLNLKDTSVRHKASDGKIYTYNKLVSYKSKPCDVFAINPTYFKVERYRDGKLVETKFLIIEGADREVAD